jgi:lysophospholipase L1-like esterase
MASGPFRRMVVLGDSISYGMCASEPEKAWPQVVARLIREFQDEQLSVFNRGLPANVISPRCPGYDESAKPSLLERYQQDGVDLEPDLVLIAEGLNDMRSGMPVQDYVADLETIVADISESTGALVVLVGVYHQVFGRGANDPKAYPTWARWTSETAAAYNLALRAKAAQLGALFVDAHQVMAGADWLLHTDACHLNDLGHVLIGNGVFQAVATHSEALSSKTYRIIEEREVSTLNSGGADTDERIQRLWAEAAARFSEDVDQAGIR